jgi:ferrochelatase
MMNRYQGEDDFFHGKKECTGVLLVNLGTPDDPDKVSVRRYLKEFLSDPRVVEIPKFVWLPILYGAVLTKRPAPVAKLYESIWLEEGSPLLVYSNKQKEALQDEMEVRYACDVVIEIAMRYGNPSITSGLLKLKQKGARRILILPLYPQYSSTTTATTIDAVNKEMQQWRWIPELRFINHYHDDAGYIKSLAASVDDHWKKQERGEMLLMSFHGLPQRNLQLGDPYFCHCQKTARLLAEELKLSDAQWKVTFQSRFGKAEWLQPYTDKTLEELPAQGIKKLDVLCPGFASDCLETLEEMNVQNREIFLQAGGEQYNYIPALNDRPDHIRALADIIHQHTQGWLETSSGCDAAGQDHMADIARQRSREMGAKL